MYKNMIYSLRFYLILTTLLLVGSFFVPQIAGATVADYQTITLSSGWNIISTPKVLSSHQFSVAETSDNFDIYLLDPTSPSGWQTMQGAGQTEFQPLFAYFINNKTEQTQTLILNYNFDLTPAQRLFQRTLHAGWNAIGIASPSYALSQGSTSSDTNNPSNILSSITGSVGQVVDFTNGNTSLDSPAINSTWLSKTASDVNNLNDFRELKGYGVFITSSTDNYIGSQNLDLTPTPSTTIAITQKSDSPSGNVVNNTSNAVLARYTLTVTGEPIKISTLRVAVNCPTINNVGLRNGALYADGVQIGSTQTLNCTFTGSGYTNFSLGSSLIVNPSSPVALDVKADIYATGATALVAGTDSITAKLINQPDNAQGQTSFTTLDAPSADVDGNTLQVVAGGITLSKYSAYADQTAVAPLTNFKLAHFTLTANQNEAVNISTIEADLNSVSSSTTNLYVKYGTNTTSVKATAGTTNNWSINYQLTAGATIDVMVYGDISSSAPVTGVASVLISGTTASSATSVNTNNNSVLSGQTITFTTGSISSQTDGSTPMAEAVSGNQEVVAAKFKFVAQYDSYTITEAKITVNNNNGAVISSAVLKDGSTVLATVSYDSTNNQFYVTGLNIAVTANTSKVLTVDLSLVTPSADNSTTGKNIKISLSYFKALNSQGSVSTDNNIRVANDLYVYKTIPTFTSVAVSGQGTNLAASSSTSLYSFTVSADSKGPVSLKQLKFPITISDNNESQIAFLNTFKFFKGSTDITSEATIRETSGIDLTSTTSMGSGTAIVIFNTEEVIPAGESRTYTLKAIPQGFTAAYSTNAADSVATTLQGDSLSSSDAGLYYLSAASNTGLQTLYTSANHGGGGTAENIIWSDNSATSHDYNYNSSSADWFNGYLINNLPLTTFGITAGI